MSELHRMNDSQFRRARKLIRRLCANYDGGNCLPLDGGDFCPCPQLISPTLICKYFRAAVLPADRDLCAEVMREKPVKRCCVCGAPIAAFSNAAKYCPGCALRERRKKDAERKRNRPRHSAIRAPEPLAPQDFPDVKAAKEKDLSMEGQNGL